MTKPESFIFNSDYATLANDAEGTISITTSTGQVITPGSEYTFSSTITLGSRNAPTRSEMNTSAFPTIWIPTESLDLLITVLYAIDGNTYDANTTANIYRSSPTEITMAITVTNPFAFDITINGGVQLVTANVSTFLSPFET
jgi:hypothetical protein